MNFYDGRNHMLVILKADHSFLVSRPRINRRSVRISSEESEDKNRYSDHIKVVDAFDEILSELETVRVSLPKSTSPVNRIRPSSIKQRPFSTFVAKSNFETNFDENDNEERVRDSGYMSQHNSQSSVASSSTTEDFELDIEQQVFSLVDYWSLNFTGDLHYPDTLHLLMEILEKLRQRNKVKNTCQKTVLKSCLLCITLWRESWHGRVSNKNQTFSHLLAPRQRKYSSHL